MELKSHMLDRHDDLHSLQDKPLCLLSLDGGGIRGLSQLLILNEIVHRLQKRIGTKKPILPAEIFHMVGGTSTGGLVTILLGRLRLTMDEALECYTNISRKVFVRKKLLWQEGKFKSSELEKAIKEAIEEKLGKGHANDSIQFTEECQNMCKSFVCAMASNHINKTPTLFRTWEARKDPGYNCKIWEAARATSAAPRLFKQILIGHAGREVAFTDGALGCNNPVKYVMSEALQEFGEDRKIGCILSIGTGHHRSPGFDKPVGSQRFIPKDLIHVLARLATDCDETSTAMVERFREFPHVYQRLNAGIELGSIGLHEWERLGDIEAHTTAYLRQDDVQAQLEDIVDALLGFPAYPVTPSAFYHKSPQRVTSPDLAKYIFFPDYSTSEIQHLHQQSMDQIDLYFRGIESGSDSKTLILYGMAGAGKTQLAMHYCRLARSSTTFEGIIWINGSSKQTADDSLVRSVKQLFSPNVEGLTGAKALEEVSRAIEKSMRPWLIVLDNYDDPTAYRMSQVVPHCSKGQLTIVTSRSTDTTRLGIPIEIGELKEDEALKLLRGSSEHVPLRAQDCQMHCRLIVERLGYLALAIAQASAYISDRHMDLNVFLDEYEEEQRRIHAALPTIWMYQRSYSPVEQPGRQLSIGTTWELSLNLLRGDTQLKEAKVKLLSLSAFFGRRNISEELFSRYMERSSDPPTWMCQFRQAHANKIDTHLFREAITEMGRLCLLQQYRTGSRGISWRFHPVVQDWAMHRHSRTESESFILLAVDILHHSLSDIKSTWLLEDDLEDTQNHIRLRSHVSTCYDNCQKISGLGRVGVMPALKFAKFFCNEGKYEKAQHIQQYVLNELSSEAPLRLLALRQLARTLFRKGEWLEAAQVQETVVGQLIPGVEDIDGAFQLTELAYMYQWPSQKVMDKDHRMSRASQLASRGYEAITRLEGANSLAAASAMIVLAEMNYHSKSYSTARDLEIRAVAIREQCLGSEHLSTVQAKNTLAVTLAKLGQYTEAEMIHQDVRKFHLKQFGPHHPSTLEAERMLARDWRLSGKLRQARELNEDILNRAISSFEKSHPDTKSAANALWRCLIAQRQVDSADELQKEYNLELKEVEIESRCEALLDMQNRENNSSS